MENTAHTTSSDLTLDDLTLAGGAEPFYLNEGERVLWIRDNGDGTATVRIAFPSGIEDVIDADVRRPAPAGGTSEPRPTDLDLSVRIAGDNVPRNQRVGRCTSCQGGRLAFTWKGTARPACPVCGDTLTTTTRHLKAGFVLLEGAELARAERLKGGLLTDILHYTDCARRIRDNARRALEAVAAGEAELEVIAEGDDSLRWGNYQVGDRVVREGYSRRNIDASEREAERDLAKVAKFRRRLERLGGPLGDEAIARAEVLARAEAELRGLAPVAGGSNELDDVLEELHRAPAGGNITKAAELLVLDYYNDVRAYAGHDYGSGQRGNELLRRRRELDPGAHVTPYVITAGESVRVDGATIIPGVVELAAAARRLLMPRIQRIEHEDYRRSTPATRRTLDALWQAFEHFTKAEAALAERELIRRRGLKPVAGGTNELDATLDELEAKVKAERARALNDAKRIDREYARTGSYITGQAAAASGRRADGLEHVLSYVGRLRAAGDVRVAELVLRGTLGDKIAARAAKAYPTDAALEAAERASAEADYTDGGSPAPQSSRPAPATAFTLFDE